MQKNFLFILLMAMVSPAFAQVLYKSTSEVGEKNYVPSAKLKEKVSKIMKEHDWERGEAEDKDFYQLKNGYISYYQDADWAGFRFIFDSKQNWIETQLSRNSDVPPGSEYHKVVPKMRKQIAAKQYKLEVSPEYCKVTNAKGYWYEIKASKGKDTKTFIFDKNLNIVKMQ